MDRYVPRVAGFIGGVMFALFTIGCGETSQPSTPTVDSVSFGFFYGHDSTAVYDRNFMAYSSVREAVVIVNGKDVSGVLPRTQFTTAWTPGLGVLTFRTSTLSLLDVNSSSYGADLSNLLVDGSTQSFTLTGCSYFPTDTLVASIVGPTGLVLIHSPSNGDTINKSNSLIIQWTAATGNQNVAILISSRENGSVTGKYYETTDNGSFTISSADMSSLPNGLCDVQIIRGHVNTGTAPDDSKWIGLLFTQHSVTVRLQ